MLARTGHLFDDATQVTAGDSRWQGQTSDDYWAFVGPFGGATAARPCCRGCVVAHIPVFKQPSHPRSSLRAHAKQSKAANKQSRATNKNWIASLRSQ